MSEHHLTAPVMRAFCLELEKEAGAAGAVLSHLKRPGTLHAVQAGLGSGLGVGMLGGAALGAAKGGKAQYDAARANGQGALGAAAHSVGGGLAGALRGAGKGALIGAGVGAAAGAAVPTQLLRGTRALAGAKNVVGDAANFGQRQVHGLTGWKPGGATKSIESIGGGAAGAREALTKATAKGGPDAIGRAQGALGAAEDAQRMGLTSLPGVAKSLKNNGIVPTIAAGAKEQWKSSPAWQKGLMVGLPGASIASTLAKKDDGQGPGKGERIGKTIGGTLGYSMAPLSLGASTVLGTGLEHAGGMVGRGVDRLRGRKPQVPQEPTRPPASEPGDTGQHAVEHVYGTGYNGGSPE